MPSGNWLAEERPAYMHDRSARPPVLTDEDAAHSSPEVLTREVSRKQACEVLADRLLSIANMRYIQALGQTDLYLSAALTIRSGAEAVQIDGRIYRIVES